MDLLIKFLVFKMNTMDCMKDSASLHIDASTLYETKYREKRLKKERAYQENIKRNEIELQPDQIAQIKYNWTKRIYQQAIFKYKIMRVRAKICYQAFQNRQSINELFVSQIMDSYVSLTASGSIPKTADYTEETMIEFNDILNGDSAGGDTINRLMVWHMDPQIMARKRFIYERKEIVGLGYNSMDEVPGDIRKNLEALIERNMTPNARS